MANLADAGSSAAFKLSVVMTRQNHPASWTNSAIADRYGAQLRLTQAAASGRGADVWDELHRCPPSRSSSTMAVAHGEQVLTGDSSPPVRVRFRAGRGLNLCGPAGWSASSTRWATSTPAVRHP